MLLTSRNPIFVNMKSSNDIFFSLKTVDVAKIVDREEMNKC